MFSMRHSVQIYQTNEILMILNVNSLHSYCVNMAHFGTFWYILYFHLFIGLLVNEETKYFWIYEQYILEKYDSFIQFTHKQSQKLNMQCFLI